jgi:hypothetical protein
MHSVLVQDFIRSCLLRELTTSQLVAIATRSDTGSHNRLDLIVNFKQITRVELKFVQYSEGDYILCMTSRYFCRSFTNVRLLCFAQ